MLKSNTFLPLATSLSPWPSQAATLCHYFIFREHMEEEMTRVHPECGCGLQRVKCSWDSNNKKQDGKTPTTIHKERVMGRTEQVTLTLTSSRDSSVGPSCQLGGTKKPQTNCAKWCAALYVASVKSRKNYNAFILGVQDAMSQVLRNCTHKNETPKSKPQPSPHSWNSTRGLHFKQQLAPCSWFTSFRLLEITHYPPPSTSFDCIR